MIILAILLAFFAVMYMNETYKVWLLKHDKQELTEEVDELIKMNIKLSYKLEQKKQLLEMQDKLLEDNL